MPKNPLEKIIGIIGGGQLGKMMILEAKKMGFRVIILDPTLDCPAHSIADGHIVAALTDENAIMELAHQVDVVTYEIEHINVEALLKLEAIGKEVYPTPKSLQIIQNKLTQKQTLRAAGLPVPDFCEVRSIADIAEAIKRYSCPMMLKACTGGYDGRGNYCIKSEDEIEIAFQALGGGSIPLMAERFERFSMEVSALACRSIDGKVAVYPIAENLHRDNILIETRVPAAISPESSKAAMALAGRVMEVFGGVGMFCVEMFITENGVVLNEVAPRPHNSGHYSIEACSCSQFEQHIRAVSGLPLGDAALLKPVAMRNILGAAGYDGVAQVLGAEECLSIPGVTLHIYGKEKTKPQRKMGHLTALADTVEEAASKAAQASDTIKTISI